MLVAKVRLLALGCALLAACKASPTVREHTNPSASVTSAAAPPPINSVVAIPAPSASASAEAAATTPFELRPAVQFKDQTDGNFHHLHAEPGAMIGTKQEFVKAFDCKSPGAPRQDVIGLCVAFADCRQATPATPDVLAAIRCSGPALTLELVREGKKLGFRVAENEQPLARHAMTVIDLPEGSRPELKPFKKKYVHAYVDL
jgi:hypothetical protein